MIKAITTLIIGIILACLLTTCAAAPPPLTIFAAASLTEAFTDLAEAFETAHPDSTVHLNFAGSQTLRLQLEAGAQADLFVSANQGHMTALHAQGLVNQPTVVAQNRLAVIVPADNPAQVTRLAELAHPNLKLILAAEAVPIGEYSRQLLRNLNQAPTVSPNFANTVLQNLVSEEDNVKGVLSKVSLGEADVGIVYQSDVRAAAVQSIAVPTELNVTANYFMAVLANSSQKNQAKQVMTFILSPEGQTLLRKHDFQPVRP